jgi:O-succinylbenzoic acid--CoA ligase
MVKYPFRRINSAIMARALEHLQQLKNNHWLITHQPINLPDYLSASLPKNSSTNLSINLFTNSSDNQRRNSLLELRDYSQEFANLAQGYYQELIPFIDQNITPKILINEPDPIQFLAKFLATTAADLPIFLGNPQWQIQEWQQVEKLIQPNLIWSSLSLEKLDYPVIENHPSYIMIPTGGTSGTVKFAMHTWQTLCASVVGLQNYFERSVINSFCVLPVYHVSGLMQFMRSLLTGGKLVITTTKYLENNLNSPLDISNCREIFPKISTEINPQEFFLSLVPTQLQKLLTNPQAIPWLTQFSAIFLGGGAAWQELLTQARALQIPLALTYGMTETASQIATLKPQDFLGENSAIHNTCGQVLPHAQLSLSDLGVITIKSTSLAVGYYPELWENNDLRTDDLGDLEIFNKTGYLSIVGRQSLQIITGGEKVFPPEVEAAILATKLVQDVCVLGISDKYWGEAVAAVYVPIKPDINLDTDLEDITKVMQSSIAPHLAKYKIPKLWFSRSKLPRNAQGKINYQTLKAELKLL